MLKKLRQLMQVFGFNAVHFYQALRGLPYFILDAVKYRSLVKQGSFKLSMSTLYPVLDDRFSQAGNTMGHYFHQDLWVARKVFHKRPDRHVDIGSRIDGFVSHLLVFMKVEVIDVRPLISEVEGLAFRQANAANLTAFPDASLQSVSCLHAAEHFGLGRYGDEVDPEATFNAMRELQRVLAPGGVLYFSVPIGRERLCFNAHRIFSPLTVLQAFKDFHLVSFAVVDDQGKFISEANPEQYVTAHGACGIFEFENVSKEFFVKC